VVSAHSPGPWAWGGAGHALQAGDGGLPVFDAFRKLERVHGVPMKRADARLIAAAPELLAMLEGVTDGLSKDAYGCTDGTCLKCQAEALIARVKDGT
jgi:hypothetical protein